MRKAKDPGEPLFEWGRTWQGNDTCGDRQTGEAVVMGNTPIEYKLAFVRAVEEIKDSGPFTTEEVRDLVGMPPNHPSAVGALMSAAAKLYGLHKVGSRRAIGRHQHLLTVWGK